MSRATSCTRAFAVETGAFFEGNCRHADNPLAEDANKKMAEFRGLPTVPSSAPASAPAPVSHHGHNGPAPPAPVAAGFAPLKSNA